MGSFALSNLRSNEDFVDGFVSDVLCRDTSSTVVHVLADKLLRKDSFIEDGVFLKEIAVLLILEVELVLQVGDLVREDAHLNSLVIE